MQVVTPQIFRDEIVEMVFTLFWREFLQQRMPLCKRNVGRNLPPQRAVANRSEPGFQCFKNPILIEVRILFAKATEVTKGKLVDKTDQTEQLKQRILQWCCCQQ